MSMATLTLNLWIVPFHLCPTFRSHAVTMYRQGNNQQRLSDVLYVLEDYNGLVDMMKALPENHKLLPAMAQQFVSVGMCDQAVEAYTKVSILP